jgi:signal transduction histidine kinase
MMAEFQATTTNPNGVADLQRRVAKLEHINAALMAHVERATDQRGNAHALFQTAILLEAQVRSRTEELTMLMHSLERSNRALSEAKDDAETANRSKTRFLAAAGHDLLQPLNAARLSASALADLPLGPEARAIAGQVERGLETIESLIKSLLDISKLDAGIVHPMKRAVRLRDIIAGIDASYYSLATEKGLSFIVRCPDAFVDTDPTLIQRILQNLVSNAIRYTRTGGVMIAARLRGTTCVIDVFDTGCGIADDEVDLVFEEFYRGRRGPETNEAYETGLGLGLSIVRRMAAALGHDLELRSRVNRGSRFRIKLPLGRKDAIAKISTDTNVGSLAGLLVVVVENDRATLTALTRLLQSWGTEVIAGRDHSEVAGLLSTVGRIPDLIVADFHLDDGATGLEVMRRLRMAAGTALPAILVTADHSSAIEGLAADNHCVVAHKPLKPAQLRCLISHVLSQGA